VPLASGDRADDDEGLLAGGFPPDECPAKHVRNVCGDAGRPCLPLAAGNRANDDEGLLAGCDRVGQRGVGRLVGKILLAGEEAQEHAALLRVMVTDGAPQHGIAGLEGVEH